MADLFQFTNPISNTILLKDGKAGPLRQTTTSTSNLPIQSVAQIILIGDDLPAAAESWIRLDKPKATFKANSTVHFDVFVEVPKGAYPNKEIKFQLSVANEGNTEDDACLSPIISVMTENDGPPPPPPFNWKIVALIAGLMIILLIIGVGVMLALTPGDPGLKLKMDVLVYDRPTIDSLVITTIAMGDEVKVLMRVKDQDWYQVSKDNVALGWITVTDEEAEKQGDFDSLDLAPMTPTSLILTPLSPLMPTAIDPGPVISELTPPCHSC